MNCAVSVHSHASFDRHTGAQAMLSVGVRFETDPNGETLHHLHEIPARIFRWKQAEKRTGRTRQLLYRPLVLAVEGVDANRRGLTRTHLSPLRFFEIRRDPD